MVAREVLARMAHLRARRDALIAEYEDIQSGSIKGVRYDQDKVQISKSGGVVESIVIRLDDIREEFAKVNIRYTEARLDLSELICRLESTDYFKIIIGLYVDGKSISDMAKELGKGNKTIEKWRDAALKELDRIGEDVIADGEL